jgi:hypothetical protein
VASARYSGRRVGAVSLSRQVKHRSQRKRRHLPQVCPAGACPLIRRRLQGLLFELACGMTVVVTTHYMDEAERCDRRAYIYNSKLMVSGSPGGSARAAGSESEWRRRLEIDCSEPSKLCT